MPRAGAELRMVVAIPDDLPAALAGALAAVASYARLIVLPVGLHLERFVSGGGPWTWGFRHALFSTL